MIGSICETFLPGLTVAALAGGIVSCNQNTSEEKPLPAAANLPNRHADFCRQGRDQGIEADGRTVVLSTRNPQLHAGHDDAVRVKDTNELTGLQPGDGSGSACCHRRGWIESLKWLAQPTWPSRRRETFRRVRAVERWMSRAMPDYPFTTSSAGDSSRHFKASAGLQLSSTRAVPAEFCPRMSGNFAEACKKLGSLADARRTGVCSRFRRIRT